MDPPKKQFDLIITDPPYGFNNELNATTLATLLSRSLDVFMRHLKPNGQLMLVLPDTSAIEIGMQTCQIWQVFENADQ